MFERVYCINLERRPDRWQKFCERLPGDWPFKKPERVRAIDGKRVKHPEWWRQGGGAWGCYRSHLRLIEQCLNEGVESVLLLEDDALFPEDFTRQFTEFIRHVPSDWGMLYLGGQHLFAKKHPPEKINDWVYRPHNVNRTHAFALRGMTMLAVYRHLHSQDWKHGHHIDHHLGRFHAQKKHPIYCPKEWLVGQAEGKSNISGKRPPDRFWADAEKLEAVNPDTQPFVAVVGLHSSGSSCLAGVLYHMGLHLGNELGGYYGKDPSKSCGFEAVGLASLCERAIPFPSVEYALPRGKIFNQLKGWINQKRREAYLRDTIAAGKYPHLCRMGDQLLNICGDQLRLLHINRPLEASIASLIRREPQRDPGRLRAHQEWLWEGKLDLLAKAPDVLAVEYDDLLADPLREVERIADWLGISLSAEAMASAASYVQPEKQHIKAGAA